ncbi:hypothetical protein EPA93_41000 [Ktedonosporobacter rubrisoli]|uniref:DUF1080 domain-containing protein n=1 Tax=Ktedonosporobacter rubrisoli TaxID=2509675 RepID=A0A4P6K2S9_KTERU|nr:hypothetical protein [Ktedonosporobacter rubrisoli]QBD82020.1 hypothetical protein EPA93_41000 [Ktedonosporobacter rubrisoli]
MSSLQNNFAAAEHTASQLHRPTALFSHRGGSLLLLMVYLVISLVACTTGPGAASSSTPSPTAKPQPTQIPAGTVLYKGDWSNGLTGWQATSGWKLEGNYAQSALSDNNTLTSPYTPKTNNYSVEFRLQVVSIPKDGGYYILAVSPSKGQDGVQARVLSLLGPGEHGYATHPMIEIVTDPENDNVNANLATAFDFEPTTKWHTYRLDVRGRQAALYIDDQKLSSVVTVKESPLSEGPIKFICGKAILRISDFRILAL